MPWTITTLAELGLPADYDVLGPVPFRRPPCPVCGGSPGSFQGRICQEDLGDRRYLQCDAPACTWSALVRKALSGQAALERWVPESARAYAARSHTSDGKSGYTPAGALLARHRARRKALHWRTNPDIHLPEGWGKRSTAEVAETAALAPSALATHGQRHPAHAMPLRGCELCGSRLRATNRVGVCRRSPACSRKALRRAYQLRTRGAFTPSPTPAEPPAPTESAQPVSPPEPSGALEAPNAPEAPETAVLAEHCAAETQPDPVVDAAARTLPGGRCVQCGGPLRAGTRVDVCSRNPACRAKAQRMLAHLRAGRPASGIAWSACTVCGHRMKPAAPGQPDICTTNPRCKSERARHLRRSKRQRRQTVPQPPPGAVPGGAVTATFEPIALMPGFLVGDLGRFRTVIHESGQVCRQSPVAASGHSTGGELP